MDILQSADPVLYFLGLSSALKLALYYKWLGAKPREPELVGHVTDFFLYPLKSGHGVPVKELTCTAQDGPHFDFTTDRHWMVADSNNDVITYKQQPRLSTLIPVCEATTFTLTGPGISPLVVQTDLVEKQRKQVTINLYGTTVTGLDCGDAPAAFLNNLLQSTGYRLVYAPKAFDTKRPVMGGNMKYAVWTRVAKESDKLAYQSVTPYHILTWESLEDLNSRLAQPVGVDRFRPNIVIKGDKAYSEDTWKEMIIGQTRFSTIKLCGRCVFITIDTDTGVVAKSQEPLKTLNSYRKLIPDPIFGPCLGIQMVLDSPGTIRIGDPVYVIRGDNTLKPK